MIQQESISANDARDWRMFIMKAYGQPIARNLARCPTLAALIASSPDVLSASLSFLAPGKQVPPHRGRSAAFCAAIWCWTCPNAPTGCRRRC